MRKTVIAIALGLACTPLMAEKLYKWVDENGVTQFSQQPPVSSQYERMNVTAPPKLGSEMAPEPAESSSTADAPDDSPATAATQQQTKEQQALQEAQCAKLREDLTTMENNPRLGRTNAAGEMERIGEDERQSMIAKAREELATHCD
ncbi:MAG: DUF4124 domain-containing protein [Halopseudomonas sp.]|uniref:DUF4124 domain-containing protein n=1 Tax=Halopseudomonas sp. TaxID=2901191 RepID=UPI0030037447